MLLLFVNYGDLHTHPMKHYLDFILKHNNDAPLAAIEQRKKHMQRWQARHLVYP